MGRYADLLLQDNPVALWAGQQTALNGGVRDVANDYHVNELSSLAASPIAKGPSTAIPRAVQKNGTYTYLRRASSLGLGAGTYTIEGWFRLHHVTGNTVPVYVGDSAGNGFGLFIDSGGRWTVLHGGRAVGTAGPVGIENRWQHIAARYDGAGAFSLFVDGTSVLSTGITSPNAPGAQVAIGSVYTGDNPIEGDWAMVAMYATMLTAASIQDRYRMGRR